MRYCPTALFFLALVCLPICAMAAQGFNSTEGSDLPLGASNAEYMRITASGNVGIGTTTPSVRLEVAQNEALKLGNAFLSSGGDFVHLANNEWYNGSKWLASAVGGLYQISGKTHAWGTHDALGSQTATMILDAGNLSLPYGGVQLRFDGSACTGAKAGTIIWNGSNFYGCNGSAWKLLGQACTSGQCIKSDGTCGQVTVKRMLSGSCNETFSDSALPLGSWSGVVGSQGCVPWQVDVLYYCA